MSTACRKQRAGRRRWRRARVGGWAAACLAALLAIAAPASASTYTNPGAITVPDTAVEPAPANPYPSTIDVAGLPAQLVRVRVTLHSVSHRNPRDLDVVLAAPGGSAMLMSDVCNDNQAPLTGQTFTFDETAPRFLPTLTGGFPCPSGTYHPTNQAPQNDVLPPGAPPGPYPESLAVIEGTASNGSWRLFVADDSSTDGGAIAGGWTLELLPSVRCGGRAASVAAHVGTAGDDVIEGTPARDVMLGLGGRDTLRGLGGKDLICGGGGKDRVKGGSAADKLLGQAGKDRLGGGSGSDNCKGGKGSDDASRCEAEKGI